MSPTKFLRIALLIALLAPGAWAQSLIDLGNILSDRTFNSDTGPTNSQLTFDFTIPQAGVLQNILTWGESSGSGLSGIGQSFEVFVLRPLNTTNYQVVFATGYFTVTNVGNNIFTVAGSPFGLRVGDVVAHYGRGIPFDNNAGGPGSVYIAANLPAPVVGSTITAPSATYPLYNDGGRNYAMQVVALVSPFRVTTNGDNGPGSLRQAVLNANVFAGASTISFAPGLSGQTILLTSGQLEVSNNVTIDASALANSVAIDGNASSRIFQVDSGVTVVLNSLTITNGNDSTALANSQSSGGGILNLGTLTLIHCSLLGNMSVGQASDSLGDDFQGGGGILNLGQLTVSQSMVAGNKATAGIGGGINNLGTLVIKESTIFTNLAVSGGGLYAQNGSSQTLEQCTLTGNVAKDYFVGGYGGAIDVNGATVALIQSTILSNSASNGGGAMNGSGTITISNTIATGNSPNNLTISFTGSNNLTNGSALLAPLGNYGGPTPTMPPLPGSPAIDAGALTTLTVDQRGFPRIAGASVDIGAVEFQANPVVTTADVIAGSLRYAVTYATNNSTITFDPSLSGQTVTLSNGQITITNHLTIDGSALANGIRIQNLSGRMFQINSSATVVMNSLTLTNGNCSSAGGAILNEGGNLTLNRSTLAGSHSQGDGGGGAIFNDANSTLALNQCTLTANHASQQGGAIYNFTPATLTLVNCTISGNTANESSSPRGGSGGGGILNSGTMFLVDDIVASNSDPVAANISGSFTGANNLTSGNPQLAALGNYGGPTPTMPPLPGSPAIDAGGTTSFTTDQRGYPRPVGLAADIGAVEGIYNAAGPGTIKTFARLGNGSVQFSFTNVTDAVFPVLATTNLSLSISNWAQIGFVSESPVGSGQFSFTDTQATNYPQRFYLISSP